MSATRAVESSISRNIEIASRFLDRLAAMPPAERGRLSAESFGSSAHTTAMLTTADEITTLKNKDRDGRLTAFLVEAEHRIDGLGVGAELGGLARGAVRAILAHDVAGQDSATRQLYSPFEKAIPFRSLAD